MTPAMAFASGNADLNPALFRKAEAARVNGGRRRGVGLGALAADGFTGFVGPLPLIEQQSISRSRREQRPQ
jgi:hypothetical protein